ncbi:MAG: molecular chaperone [Sphingomicrobium sp.]
MSIFLRATGRTLARSARLGFATLALLGVSAANAGVGDLLVAPTRLVLNGSRGSEIIIKNVGEETATYRVSVELRRMLPNGSLSEVVTPSADEKTAQDMIFYAPRKVTLPPNQPQSVRVTARVPAGLPDGEYRVHLLFRAIPDPRAVTAPADFQGVGFRLTPIYGVTIPVIVRLGNLEAKAGIADVKLIQQNGRKAVTIDLTRSGNRSTYGEIRVIKDGLKQPLAELKGVAVYRELDVRKVTIPVTPEFEAQANGSVKVQYFETTGAGSSLVAEISANLR